MRTKTPGNSLPAMRAAGTTLSTWKLRWLTIGFCSIFPAFCFLQCGMQVTPSSTCVNSLAFLGIKGFRETSKFTFLSFILLQGWHQSMPTIRFRYHRQLCEGLHTTPGWSAAQTEKLSLAISRSWFHERHHQPSNPPSLLIGPGGHGVDWLKCGL